MTDEELDALMALLKKKYDAEDKPLFKRYIGGKMISILKEQRKRKQISYNKEDK